MTASQILVTTDIAAWHGCEVALAFARRRAYVIGVVAPVTLFREARALRRIALLVDRARQDCGSRHPELAPIANLIDRLSACAAGPLESTAAARSASGDLDRLWILLDTLDDGLTKCDGGMCDLVGTDLLAELRELRQRLERHRPRAESPDLALAR